MGNPLLQQVCRLISTVLTVVCQLAAQLQSRRCLVCIRAHAVTMLFVRTDTATQSAA
jgi:hypothetical protein